MSVCFATLNINDKMKMGSNSIFPAVCQIVVFMDALKIPAFSESLNPFQGTLFF